MGEGETFTFTREGGEGEELRLRLRHRQRRPRRHGLAPDTTTTTTTTTLQALLREDPHVPVVYELCLERLQRRARRLGDRREHHRVADAQFERPCGRLELKRGERDARKEFVRGE